jgi:hypothetical protein
MLENLIGGARNKRCVRQVIQLCILRSPFHTIRCNLNAGDRLKALGTRNRKEPGSTVRVDEILWFIRQTDVRGSGEELITDVAREIRENGIVVLEKAALTMSVLAEAWGYLLGI